MIRWMLVVAALLGAMAAASFEYARAERAQRSVDQITAAFNAERQARQQESRARQIEARQTARIQEALDAEHIARTASEAAMRRADAASVSLRQRAAAIARAGSEARAGTPVATGGPSADPAGYLLADLLGRLDEAAGELGRYADQARIAGLTCERAYQAVTEAP